MLGALVNLWDTGGFHLENFISGMTGPNCSSATIRASSGGLSRMVIGT